MRTRRCMFLVIGLTALFLWNASTHGSAANKESEAPKVETYDLGTLKPTNSVLKVKVGDRAPDFTLPAALSKGNVSLSQYLGKRNVVLSFVPAAWTSVCSAQWPSYYTIRDVFHKHNAVLLGITVDNAPTLFMWTKHMCRLDNQVWFPVLSDFSPHGAVADMYGVLRPEGFSERAIFVIDKKGIIRYIGVYDINQVPPLIILQKELEKLGE